MLGAHYILHGPGFLDIPLVPEQYILNGPGLLDVPLVQKQHAQIPAATHPPPSTVRLASRQRTVIQSPGRGSARPRAVNDPYAHTEVPKPTMSIPGVNLEALANLQVDNLRKLIEILQGLAASRTEETPTPTAPSPPPVPATEAGGEEAILWEQFGTGHVLLPEGPPTRPPPPHNPINEGTLDNLANPINNPPTPDSTFLDICSRQQRTNSLATYPAIFDLQDDGGATRYERMNILASLPRG